jgi:Undecaprenyl-phosphate glucose phosphotransferase
MTWGGVLSILLLLAFLTKTTETFSRGWALGWIIFAPISLLAGRCFFCIVMARSVQASYWFVRNVAIVGAGEEGQRLIASLQRGNDRSVVIRGLFDDRSSRIPDLVCGLAVDGTTDDLLRFARSTPVDEVVIALPLHAEQRLKSLCEKLKAVSIDIRLSIEPLAEAFRGCRLGYVGEIPTLSIVDRPLKNWGAIVKLVEDKVLCSLALVLASPLMALIAIFIKIDTRGPVFFFQERFGFNNEVIKVIKFRTMAVDQGDPSGAQRTVRGDPRVTRVGRILRWLSFDELPQLINVLRGEMSLVGPRPHAVAMKAGDCLYHEAISEYLHRHRVKPGITGWAQINGLRGEVDTLAKANARVAYDLYYIEHWSFWLDLRILVKTIAKLPSSENAY